MHLAEILLLFFLLIWTVKIGLKRCRFTANENGVTSCEREERGGRCGRHLEVVRWRTRFLSYKNRLKRFIYRQATQLSTQDWGFLGEK